MGFVPHLHYLKKKKEGESAYWQFIPGRTKQSTMRTAWREMHDDSLAPLGVPASPIWRLPKPHQRRVFMEISWCRCHWVSRWWLTQSPVPLPFPEDRGRGWKFQLSNDASVFLASSPHQKSPRGSQPPVITLLYKRRSYPSSMPRFSRALPETRGPRPSFPLYHSLPLFCLVKAIVFPVVM